MRTASFSLFTILCLALGSNAFADLYDNGPTNGTSNAYFIDVYVVSDSFNPSGSPMNGYTFAEWVFSGATPLSVNWSVGTTSFGSDIGSGSASGANFTPTLLCTSGQGFNGGICGGGFGYDVYGVTVNTGILAVSGTDWLTMTGATDNFGGRDAWDINNGPSTAYHNLLGQVQSESFTINGTTCGAGRDCGPPVPESSSVLLFGSGILGLAGVLRRKLNI